MPAGTLGRILRKEVMAEARTAPTRRQAQALLDERLRKINHGQHIPQAVETFSEFVRQHWVPTVLPTFRPSTAEVYKVNLKKHILPHFAEMRLCNLSTADVQAFVIEKAEAGLSWNTVNHLRNLTSRILTTAFEWRFLRAHVSRGVRGSPKQSSSPRRVVTGDPGPTVLPELAR